MESNKAEQKFQKSSNLPRELTVKEQEKLRLQDKKLVSKFRQDELERSAQKMWDLFYKRNKTNFFKDRHWTLREFIELSQKSLENSQNEKMVILEAGCGVGNFLFPVLDEIPNLFMYACDFSPRAIEFVKRNERYDTERCEAFYCDVTTENCFFQNVSASSVDIVTLIFVLSAIHPEKFENVLKNCFEVLKPGGFLLLRDYGLNDHAMLRFAAGNKLFDKFYVRQDGTRAYYFTLEVLENLAKKCHFEIVSNEYVLRETVNKKEDLCVPRVFVQSKLKKIL